MTAYPPHTEVELRIPSRLGLEQVAMVAAAHMARRMGFSEERVEDITLAVSEACVNAIEHGNRLQEDLAVLVVLTMEPDRLEIKIVDQGPGIEPEALVPPDIARKVRGEESPRGMGLYLIRKLVDECEFARRSEEGSCTRLAFRLKDDRKGASADKGTSGD